MAARGASDPFATHGKVAVVTGASSGLGEATARRLAGAGMTVWAVARREERLKALAAESDLIIPFVADVTSTADIDRLAVAVAEVSGACHVLVNNAGVPGGPLWGRDELEDTLRTIDINLGGAIRCTAAFADLLEASAPSRIVNIASVSGKIGIGPAGYVASKFGMVGVSEALALSWADRGITVTQLNPGYIETEGFPQTQVKRGPMGRLVGEPDLIADAVEEVVRTGVTERTAPRWYALLVKLRHVAPPLYRMIASRQARASGTRD